MVWRFIVRSALPGSNSTRSPIKGVRLGALSSTAQCSAESRIASIDSPFACDAHDELAAGVGLRSLLVFSDDDRDL